MARMEYRAMIISWARKREEQLGFTVQDREELLGTRTWKQQTITDIKAYVEILSEEIEERR